MNSASKMDMRWVVPARGEARRLAVEHDAAANEDEALDVALDRPELVRDEDDRRSQVAVKLFEQGRERLLGVDVDTSRRLVQNEQVGLAGEGLGDECSLLLAA